MPFSGTTFTKLYEWYKDHIQNQKIRDQRLDDELGGIATGLSTVASKRIVQYRFTSVVAPTTVVGTSFSTTGVADSITPSSASNKILVIATGALVSNTYNAQAIVKLRRAGSDLPAQTLAGGDNSTAISAATLLCLDSPASTSSLTYDTQVASDTVGATAIFPFDGSNTPGNLVLIELAP